MTTPDNATPTDFPGVYEVDTNRQTGFLVHIERRGHKIFKMVSFAQHKGDREKAFKAAQRLATDFYNQHPRYVRVELMEILTKRNSSGKRGVRIREHRHKWKSNPDKESIYYDAEATWASEPYVYKKKTFSLNVYGEEEAWRLACEAREEGLRQCKK